MMFKEGRMVLQYILEVLVVNLHLTFAYSTNSKPLCNILYLWNVEREGGGGAGGWGGGGDVGACMHAHVGYEKILVLLRLWNTLSVNEKYWPLSADHTCTHKVIVQFTIQCCIGNTVTFIFQGGFVFYLVYKGVAALFSVSPYRPV